jgi:hypothetical protein
MTRTFPRGIYLISCVSRKRTGTMRAEDLYNISAWFDLLKQIVIRDNPWYILSAKYGLVHPDDLISSYDESIFKMSYDERRAWAAKVCEQMRGRYKRPPKAKFQMLTGGAYRQFLVPLLTEWGATIDFPLGNMRLGPQMRLLVSLLSPEQLRVYLAAHPYAQRQTRTTTLFGGASLWTDDFKSPAR